MNRNRIAILAGVLALGVSAHATWYTNEASFVAAINPVYYLEDFNNFTFGNPLNGSQTTWAAPGANGYGGTYSAAGGLYSNPGAMSTNLANDPITYTFSGNPVTAFGGNLANSDITGALIPGTITITFDDGTTSSVTTTGANESFLGWVGPQTLLSATFTATGTTNNWVNLDHVYEGAGAVPEPASMAALAIGGLALLRRRKKA